MSVASKVKGTLVLGVLIAGTLLVAPHIGEGPGEQPEHKFGPERPGKDKRTGCRFMSLEVEAGLGEKGPDFLPATLDAMLGPPSGDVFNQRITLPNYSRSGLWFKQEFCSMPGSQLQAHVSLNNGSLAELMFCYFYDGPHLEDNDRTTHILLHPPGQSPVRAVTCQGIVP